MFRVNLNHLSSIFWCSFWTSAGRHKHLYNPKCTEVLSSEWSIHVNKELWWSCNSMVVVDYTTCLSFTERMHPKLKHNRNWKCILTPAALASLTRAPHTRQVCVKLFESYVLKKLNQKSTETLGFRLDMKPVFPLTSSATFALTQQDLWFAEISPHRLYFIKKKTSVNYNMLKG